jgi:hypothetical protein
MTKLKGSKITAEPIVTIGDFVENVYLPWVRENKKPRTYNIQQWLNRIGEGVQRRQRRRLDWAHRELLDQFSFGTCFLGVPTAILGTFQQALKMTLVPVHCWPRQAEPLPDLESSIFAVEPTLELVLSRPALLS